MVCCVAQLGHQMEGKVLAAAAICTAAICTAGMLMADFDGGALRSAAQSRTVDSVFSGLVKPNEPGLAVLVRSSGRDVYRRGFGVRDLRSKAPIDAATNFRLASFTKQFTAMGIMLLVHDGKLRYGLRLTEVFPDFPAYGARITIRNLLNHTAGLPDYEDLMDAVEKRDGAKWSAERQIHDDEVLNLLKHESHGKFLPGTSWDYSNSGYVVLGAVIAKISGKTYGDFLQQRIFAPLRMNHTLAYVKGKNEPANRAYGHGEDPNGFHETDQSATSATLGDGGIYSNLEDLAKWDDALRSHTLLSEEEMKPALTPATVNDGSEPHWPVQANEDNLHPGKAVSYGFGWFLDAYELHGKHPRMYHTGTTSGFRTAIERFSEQNFTVIILSNRTDLDVDNLALQVAANYPALK